MSEMPSDGPALVLKLVAQFENLERVRSWVAGCAEEYGLTPAGVYAVQLAVDEAFTNIVEHAYGGECQEKIECTCQITEDGLVVTLRDCGQPFNPNGIPEPDFDANLEAREVGGLGLFFIRHLMDEVEFEFITEREPERVCNQIRMVKRKERPA
jgi:serine/threonine-protein kinase RsbW